MTPGGFHQGAFRRVNYAEPPDDDQIQTSYCGELLMLLPFKAMLLLERARPKIWRSEQILDLRQTG